MANVFLASAGYRLTLGLSESTGQKIFFDASARPDATTTTLPVIGDSWDNSYPGITCRQIDKVPIGDDTSAGFMYTCSYSSAAVQRDYLEAQGNVSVSITVGSKFDSWTNPSPIKGGKELWKTTDGMSWYKIDAPQPISVQFPVTNVSVTSRYRGNALDLIAINQGVIGCINSGSMWGFGAGCILFTGTTASPVKEINNGETVVAWNINDTYSIRTLPNITEDTWQHTFSYGEYVRLATKSGNSFTYINTYAYATLPDKLSH